MSELLVNTIKKADGTGALSVPAESGTVVVKDGSNDVTLNDITAGGIYLGGTGSANYLDDYEEGTWTPVIEDESGNDATTGSGAEGTYTKIGDLVFIELRMFDINTSGMVGADDLRIRGMPYTIPLNNPGNRQNMNVEVDIFNFSGYLTARITGSTNRLYITQCVSGISDSTLTINAIASSNADLCIAGVYKIWS